MAGKDRQSQKLARLREELLKSITRIDEIEREMATAVRDAARLQSKVTAALARWKAVRKR